MENNTTPTRMENSAKQKAVEMVENFRPFSNATIGGSFYFNVEKENAKQCALIAVDREYNARIEAYNSMYEFCPDVASQAAIFAKSEYEQVRSEIEKL